jgi:hypothetical protein
VITRVDIDMTVVRAMVNGPGGRKLFGDIGRKIRDRARINARVISDKTDAIISVVDVDERGIRASVGYKKRHPGFYLWWWEVGTRNHAPRPHLRPALRSL